MNVGCIPTKAILHAAEALTEAKEMAEYGIHIESEKCRLETGARQRKMPLPHSW